MTATELDKLKLAGHVNRIDFIAVRARYEAWTIHVNEVDPYGDGTPISGVSSLIPPLSNPRLIAVFFHWGDCIELTRGFLFLFN
ncbi:MAG: hypothetical protein ACOX3K_05820 [Bacilli bacterium]|jgi:hypothetical protein